MKFAAVFALLALTFTVLAPHNAVAAPTSKAPATVETAQTLSCTVAVFSKDKNGHFVLSHVDHQYFMRPNKVRTEQTIETGPGKQTLLSIDDGKTRYGYIPEFHSCLLMASKTGDRSDFGLALPPETPHTVLLNGKPALLYERTTLHGKATTEQEQTWFDPITRAKRLVIRDYIVGQYLNRRAYKFVYSDWKLNPQLPASLFAFTPPPGTKLKKLNMRRILAEISL